MEKEGNAVRQNLQHEPKRKKSFEHAVFLNVVFKVVNKKKGLSLSIPVTF